jgi:predicted transcriptional regulator
MDGQVICPYCESSNIPGEDVCDRCGQPLSDLHLKNPETLVEHSLLTERVIQLRPKRPITVSGDMHVQDVLQLMVEKRIGSVFIVDEGRPVGVFTEKDVIVRLGPRIDQCRDRPISEFMTPNPAGVKTNVRIAYAIRQMDLGGYRHIPTLGPDGRLEGVISVRDILAYLTEKIEQAAAG